VDADGYTEEYTLFTGMLDKVYSKEEIKSLYSLSAEDFEQILRWLRKYIENGTLNQYSKTTAVEKFFSGESGFLLDYFIYGTYESTGLTSSEVFLKDLPDYYWFKSEADLPDTLTFSVQVNQAVTTKEVQWVVLGYSSWGFQNYVKEIPYQVSTNGLNSELTLSAEDLLNLTALVNDQSGIYKQDTITVYAVCQGVVSNICYVNIGQDAAILKGAYYGAVESGEISMDIEASTDVALSYNWSYNPNGGLLEDYYLTMQGYWELREKSQEEALNPDNTENFEQLFYARCAITYEDADGLTHILSAPMMPVYGEQSGSSNLEEHLYVPITCFCKCSEDFYVQPDSDVTFQFFTLGDEATYSNTWETLDDEESYTVDGFTFHVPVEWARERRQMDIEANAKAPSGKVYSNYLGRPVVMQEGEAYSYNSNRPITETVLDKQVVVKDTDSVLQVITIPTLLIYKNELQYNTNGWGNKKLKVQFFVNSVPSYENATLEWTDSANYGSATFKLSVVPAELAQDTTLYYYFSLIDNNGDPVFTSELYNLGLHKAASFATEDRFYVTEEGVLYGVLTNKTEITVPEKVGDVTVKKIAGKAFYYCENLETVNLPSSLEVVEEDAFDNQNSTIKNLHFEEGLQRIENYSLPYNLETINFPSTLTFVGDFSYDPIKEVTVSYLLPVYSGIPTIVK